MWGTEVEKLAWAGVALVLLGGACSSGDDSEQGALLLVFGCAPLTWQAP